MNEIREYHSHLQNILSIWHAKRYTYIAPIMSYSSIKMIRQTITRTDIKLELLHRIY